MEPSDGAPSGNAVRTPAILVLGGGVLALISVFLTWFQLSGQGFGTRPLKGSDLTMGLGTGLFAALVGLFGLLMWVRSARTGRGLAIASIVFAALIVLIGLYAAFGPEAAISSFESSGVSEQLGISDTQAEAVLEQGFASGILSATSQVGTYVALAGGVLALVAAIVAVRARRRTAG